MAHRYSSSVVKSKTRKDEHDLEQLARMQVLQISNEIEPFWKLI